jgi:hypothetical protein
MKGITNRLGQRFCPVFNPWRRFGPNIIPAINWFFAQSAISLSLIFRPLWLNCLLKLGSEGAGLAVRGVGNITGRHRERPLFTGGQYSQSKSKVVAFAVGWHAPSWRGSGGELRYNRYSQRFRSAEEVTDFGNRNHEVLLKRVLAWAASGLSLSLSWVAPGRAGARIV